MSGELKASDYLTLAGFGVAGVLIAGIGGCFDKDETGACVERGVAYFKEIGSFPSLSDGRDPRAVALDRCKRTSKAFG